MADPIYPGSDGLSPPAGERWRNLTSSVWYQRCSSLRRPCKVCIRQHGRIYPRPVGRRHPECQCADLPISPGSSAPIEARTPAQVWRGSITSPGRR